MRETLSAIEELGMSKSMHVIAGTGLDQKTRKSHWPARLGFLQSASGLFLGNVDRVSPEEKGHGGMEIGYGFRRVGWPHGNRASVFNTNRMGQTLELK
jgi:hypothetical protein